MSALKSKMKGSLGISLNQNTPKDDLQRPEQIFKLQNMREEEKMQQSQLITGMSTIREGEIQESDAFHRKYEELETLGEGGAAVVKKCRHKQSGKEFACKVMRNYDTEKELNSRKEFDLVKSLPLHPNVVSMEEFIVTENWTYTIMELAKGIELQEFVKSSSMSITTKVIKSIMKQLLYAISHLHKENICHKDIKPENIIVHQAQIGTEITVKVIDFNVS